MTNETNCQACGGKGWLLADNSDYGLRIERCDSCEYFDSDAAAVTHVAGAGALDEMTAGELCDLIDRAARELIERNEEARLEGAHELWPGLTGAITTGFYTSVPPSEQRKKVKSRK